MVIRRASAPSFPIASCHGGEGDLQCREYLGDYDRVSPGLKFVHDDVLMPGVSIGLHTHLGDEEVYVILSGRGTYTMDEDRVEVGEGDACIVRHGQSHALENTGAEPLRLLVVGCQC
jgi:mannose-6-phosphate isomerase-like protein (cupin superfamily)